MDQAGIPVQTCSPAIDESALKSQIKDPKTLAEALARLKAQSGFQQTKAPFVIGSDQVACYEGTIFNKPGCRKKALETLKQLQGQTHQLITSVCLISPHAEKTWTNTTLLTMRPLTTQQIEAYIDEDSPLDCAGSYKLEKAGIRLFTKVQSSDFTAIQGLPMIELCNRLWDSGFFNNYTDDPV